jgi:hypothetical protein
VSFEVAWAARASGLHYEGSGMGNRRVKILHDFRLVSGQSCSGHQNVNKIAKMAANLSYFIVLDKGVWC